MKFYLHSFLVIVLLSSSFIPGRCQIKDTTSTKKFVISDIYFDGNFKTKSSILRRELTFQKGDTIKTSEWPAIAARAKDNLMNTALFNFVTIDTVHLSTGQTIVTISVEERWYLWPTPIFQIEERNFNVWWDQDHRSLDKIDYGLYLADNNTLGLRQILKVSFQLGYTHQYGLSYSIPYLDKHQKGGLQFSVTSSQNKEIAYTSIGGILTFLSTPENTLRQEYTARVDYTYRQGLYNIHYLELNFHSCTVNDTILKITTDYLPYNLATANFFGAKYFFRRDLRNYAAYPLSGYYIDFSLNDYGLGILNHPFNIIYVQTAIHKYWTISDYFYYEAMAEGKISNNATQPYYLQLGLGYSNDFVRGYEDYVVDGNDYMLVKNEIKFRFLNVPVQNLPLFGLRQFNKAYYALYLTAYSDWGYLTSPDPYVINDFLANRPLWGNGFGIDLVAYYDLIWRFEYSFNGLGQHGFFLHFQAAM
ncbi:MAG: POTRA domain-containing protein [Bacteroidia bacterium]